VGAILNPKQVYEHPNVLLISGVFTYKINGFQFPFKELVVRMGLLPPSFLFPR
jgi:hypothetical protein